MKKKFWNQRKHSPLLQISICYDLPKQIIGMVVVRRWFARGVLWPERFKYIVLIWFFFFLILLQARLGIVVAWNAAERSCSALSTRTAWNQEHYQFWKPRIVQLCTVRANTDRPLAISTTFIYQGMQTGIKTVAIFSPLIRVPKESKRRFSQELHILLFQTTKCLDSKNDNKQRKADNLQWTVVFKNVSTRLSLKLVIKINNWNRN